MPVHPNEPGPPRPQPIGRLAPPDGQWWVIPRSTSGAFPLGQALWLPVTVTDATPGSSTEGALKDPGSLRLLLQPPRQPLRTLVWPKGEIVRHDRGVFHHALTPDVAGRWSMRWLADGDFAGASEQMWFLVR